MDQEERIRRISHVMQAIERLRFLERTVKKHAYIHLGHQLDWLDELHVLLYQPEQSEFYLPTKINSS